MNINTLNELNNTNNYKFDKFKKKSRILLIKLLITFFNSINTIKNKKLLITILQINLFKTPLEKEITGLTDVVNCLTLINNTDIASGIDDGTIQIWNIYTGAHIKTLPGQDFQMPVTSLLKLNNYLITGDSLGLINFWNITNWTWVQSYQSHFSVTGLVKLSDNIIASSCNISFIELWDIDNDECDLLDDQFGKGYFSLLNLNDVIIVGGSSDGTIKFWNIKSFKCVKNIKEHSGRIDCLLRLNDYKFVSGSIDNTIKVWDIESESSLNTLLGHKEEINTIELFEDNIIISGSADNTVKFWNVTSFECLKTIQIQHKLKLYCFTILNRYQIAIGSKSKIQIMFLE